MKHAFSVPLAFHSLHSYIPKPALIPLLACCFSSFTAAAEFPVNFTTIGDQHSPAAAIRQDSTSVVVWVSESPTTASDIRARLIDSAGTPVGFDLAINEYARDFQDQPDVAMNTADGFIIVWHSYRRYSFNYAQDIWARRYAGDGTPMTGEFRTNNNLAAANWHPAVGMDAEGNAVVVWETFGRSGTSTEIYGQLLDSNGTRVGIEFPISDAGQYQHEDPDVTVEPNGDFVVTWVTYDQDGSGKGIFARRFYRSGQPKAGAFFVNDYTLGDQWQPSIASTVSGGFLIAWVSCCDGGGDGIFAKEFHGNGVSAGPEYRLNLTSSGTQSNPAVTGDTLGNMAVFWQSFGQDGSDNGIYGRHIPIIDGPSGEIAQNDYTTGSQEAPTAAIGAHGAYIVAWVSDGQDGSGTGIYAKRDAVSLSQHLAFRPLGNQEVGVPFPITVDATGTSASNASGNIALTATLGSISPFSLSLEAGSAHGEVVMDTCGFNMKIFASGASLSGSSNSFSVIGCPINTGMVAGSVTDPDGGVPSSGEVHLSDGVTSQDVALSNGQYQIGPIACGSYSLWANAPGAQSVRTQIDVACGSILSKDLHLLSNEATEIVPVIFVPGMMGSTTGTDTCGSGISLVSPTPVLPRFITWDSAMWPTASWGGDCGSGPVRSHGGLHCLTGWNELACELIGRDETYKDAIYAAPYDWREPVFLSTNTFLRKHIEYVKSRHPEAARVDIVAHSMGGLLARAYIQSAHYRSDVRKLALVGTPNQGSPNGYYLWQGGQPLEAGLAYAWVTRSLISRIDPASPLLPLLIVGAQEEVLFPWAAAYLRRFYKEHVPSIQQTLPTYPFLERWTSHPETLQCTPNPWLQDLNTDPDLDRIQYEIDAHVFKGRGVNTRWLVPVGPRSCNRDSYPDGLPRGNVLFGDGDGTVPDQSVGPPSITLPVSMIDAGTHAALVRTSSSDIADFITGSTVDMAVELPSRLTSQAEMVTSDLALHITGRTIPLLIDPGGLKLGIDPATGERLNAIPNSRSSVFVWFSTLDVSDPDGGHYELQLTGPVGETFELTLSHTRSDKPPTTVFGSGLLVDVPTIVRFTIASSGDPSVEIQEPADGPADLVADAIPGSILGTRLSWSGHLSAVEYRVYGRETFQPSFNFLGSTVATNFDAEQDWVVSEDIPTWTYAVTFVETSTKESFLSQQVTNDDRDHDGLTDIRELEFALPPNDPDADNDGLSDGDELALGTDPFLIDTDVDGAADFVEVQAGSDPLSASSTPGCILGPILVLTSQVVNSARLFQACELIQIGSGFRVDPGGEAMFQSGGSVVLTNGFSVKAGGRLRVEIITEQ